MITSADVVNAFPELAVVTSTTWTWAISFAYDEISSDAFTTADLDYAATLLAAHFAQLATASLAHGMVTQERVGLVSRNITLPTLDASDYSLTVYGLMFKRFIKNAVDYWVVG